MSFNNFERKHAEGFYTENDIETLYILQKGQCYYCGTCLGVYGEKGSYQIDHLEPIAGNGTNWPGNLALACAFCNKRKHSAATTVIWAKLKKEKGSDWVKSKVLANRKNTSQKAKLTKIRKKEREQSLDLLRQEIVVAISRNMKIHGIKPPEELSVLIEHQSYHVEICFNNSAILIPAPTQRLLDSWHLAEFNTLATSLLMAEMISGYLKKA